MTFKLQRPADYTPEMHRATDRYEAAVNGVTRAETADDLAEWQTELSRARALYSRECLKLEKARRPTEYGRAAQKSEESGR